MIRSWPLVLIASLLPGVARADLVISERSYWDHGLIYTRREVRAPDGTVTARTRPGGTVDGIGMVELALFPAALFPYVRTTNGRGVPLYWSSHCVSLTPHEDGSEDVSIDLVLGAIDATLDDWMEPTRDCSYLELRREPVAPGARGRDDVHLIKFHEAAYPGPDGSVAVTTLFYVDDADAEDDGRIVDADIDMNGVDYSFSIDGITAGGGLVYDFENILAHEVGHLLGFEHNCVGNGEDWLDDDGQPVPDCAPFRNLPASVREATMYPFSNPGETNKISLEQDDIDAMCETYPTDRDPMDCGDEPEPDGGLGVDAGAGADAGASADAGAGADAGASADAGVVRDAGGPMSDAGARADAGTASDAGRARDAAPDAHPDDHEHEDDAGCDCRAAGSGSPGPSLLVGLPLLVALRRRRA